MLLRLQGSKRNTGGSGGREPFRRTAIEKTLLGQANWDSVELMAQLYYVLVRDIDHVTKHLQSQRRKLFELSVSKYGLHRTLERSCYGKGKKKEQAQSPGSNPAQEIQQIMRQSPHTTYSTRRVGEIRTGGRGAYLISILWEGYICFVLTSNMHSYQLTTKQFFFDQTDLQTGSFMLLCSSVIEHSTIQFRSLFQHSRLKFSWHIAIMCL